MSEEHDDAEVSAEAPELPTEAQIKRAQADYEAARAKADEAVRKAERLGKVYAEMASAHVGRAPDPLHKNIQDYFATQDRIAEENAALRAHALEVMKGVVIPPEGPSVLDAAIAAGNRAKVRKQRVA